MTVTPIRDGAEAFDYAAREAQVASGDQRIPPLAPEKFDAEDIKTLRRLLLLSITSAVTLFWPEGHTLHAQDRQLPTEISQLGRTRDLSTNERDRLARENEAERKVRDPQAVMAEVNEDFMRRRELNELLSKATAADEALNYKHISETTSEIRKRSTRLKSNLALPEGK